MAGSFIFHAPLLFGVWVWGRVAGTSGWPELTLYSSFCVPGAGIRGLHSTQLLVCLLGFLCYLLMLLQVLRIESGPPALQSGFTSAPHS